MFLDYNYISLLIVIFISKIYIPMKVSARKVDGEFLSG